MRGCAFEKACNSPQIESGQADCEKKTGKKFDCRMCTEDLRNVLGHRGESGDSSGMDQRGNSSAGDKAAAETVPVIRLAEATDRTVCAAQ